LEHSFQAGLDFYQTDYVSERIDQRQRNNSDVNSLGLFFTNQTYLRDDLSLHLGYRYDDYDGTFRIDDLQTFGTADVWVKGDEFDKHWTNHPYEIGLVYSINDNTSLFGSYATSFRIPNVDEFALANEDLEPQEGKHIDLGVRHRIKGLAELSLTLFETRIKDEIFFDSALNLNRNFEDKTRRRGVELQVKFYPTEWLYLWGNYSYTEAKFEDRDTWVPLVPEHMATVGFEWQVFEPFLFAVTGQYVGERYDGNDETNDQFEKLDDYMVFDGKVSYTYRTLKLFAGINNIFDERYETLAFSESYFPMPTRNFYGGVEWVF
jgi:outer membrane receptor protein involved in Fe transport